MKTTRTVLVICAALGLTAVAPAAFAEQDNFVSGYTHVALTWTHYDTQRHHTDPGAITFTPSNLACGGIGIYLTNVNTGNTVGHTEYWTDHSTKALAADAPAPITFTVSAKRLDNYNDDTYWDGQMFY